MEAKEYYKVVLLCPKHPRLHYIFTGGRVTPRGMMLNFRKFLNNLPKGYGALDAIKIEVEEV